MPNRPSQNSNADQHGADSHSATSQKSQHPEDAVSAGDDSPETPAPPWYAAGLQFECTQCGDCCTGAPGAVWVNDEELSAIAAELGQAVGEVRLLHTKLLGGRWSLRDYPNGDCVFLDAQTRRCQVYSARPIQCRTWPFWPSNIESTISWERTCDRCPGSGAGTLYPLEVIQSQAGACEI